MTDRLEFISQRQGAAAYDVRDLGLLDDGRLCHAFSLNNHSHIVGEADTTQGIHAFLWRDGWIHDLGSPGLVYSRAIDINDDGYVLGVTDLTPHGKRIGCLWYEDKCIDLCGLGIEGAGVRAINNDGHIVGETIFDDERPPGAFLWRYGVVTDIAGPYVKGSCAEDINDAGQVVGYLTTLPQYDQAFLWTEGKLFDLGLGQAYALNDVGVSVGMTYQGNAKPLACMWHGVHRREIPLLEGCVSSVARDVNNSDEIVGEMTLVGGRKAAFLWKNEYTMDLNDLIDQTYGWSLQEAWAVNESGQIAGWGFLEHRHHGFLLTPTDRPGKQAKRLPPPKEGAEHVHVPDTPAENEESSISFQDMILQMVQQERKR
ncbi:MAG TPA: hypothetical protein VGK19_05700 [Capsulimonadaceae bacterium]|jgi:probable HAF family extracellular repeat protein